LAEARSLTAKTALMYIRNKYVHETQYETYVTQMLWAPANGMMYKNAKKYTDILQEQKRKIKPDTRSSEEIVNDMINKFAGKKPKKEVRLS
jgi:hypothetical protein